MSYRHPVIIERMFDSALDRVPSWDEVRGDRTVASIRPLASTAFHCAVERIPARDGRQEFQGARGADVRSLASSVFSVPLSQLYTQLTPVDEIASYVAGVIDLPNASPDIANHLADVRKRHALTDVRKFAGFVDQLSLRIDSPDRRARSSDTYAFYTASPSPTDPQQQRRPSLLARIADSLGLWAGDGLDVEEPGLSTRDVRWIWDSVIQAFQEEPLVQADVELVLELIRKHLRQALATRLSSRKVRATGHTRTSSTRERVYSFSFWTGNPPPVGTLLAAEDEPQMRDHMLDGGFDDSVRRSKLRRSLQDWIHRPSA